MPLWLVFAVTAIYVAGLFAIAWTADRRAVRTKDVSGWRSGIGYGLALSVYCTSWTYFGAVGTAASAGMDYVWILLGPAFVLLFWSGLIGRIGDITQRESISTLSDFLAARYGKSRGVAALATLCAVTGSLPYIALQLKSVGLSLATLVGAPARDANGLVLGTALAMSAFAILFGARASDATRRNPGLMRVLQFEALVKLAALIAVCLLSLSLIRENGVDLAQAVRDLTGRSSDGLRPTAILLLSMAAIFCLPRQFHVAMIERTHRRDVSWARWLFPLYLLATSLVVIPITVAGLAVLPGSVSPDLFVLELPLAVGSETLGLFVFLGGFSAATGMVIVATITLSAMVTNDLIVPNLLDGRFGPGKAGRVALLRIRRGVIIGLLLLAYGFYRMGGDSAALAQTGLLSFAAAAQFGPALIGAVIWRRANRKGALAGLGAGFAVWAYTLLLPGLFGPDVMADVVSGWLQPHALLGQDFGDPLAHGTIWSLGVNMLLFVLLSLSASERLRDRVQGAVFTARAEPRQAPQGRLPAQSASMSPDGLSALAARFLDRTAVRHAFERFAAQTPGIAVIGNGSADWRLVQFTEKLLARAIGASSARVIMASAVSDLDMNLDDVITLFDQRAPAERFDDHLLQSTLETIPQGLSVVDSQQRLVAWNGAYADIFDYPKELLQRGRPVADLIEHNIGEGWITGGDPRDQARRRVAHMRAGRPHIYERANPDGRTFRIEGSPTPGGGYVTTFTDITRDRQREEALRDANDRLEQRVADRTQALEDMAETLRRAREDADAANASKTRFLAAASHDLLQPLNAARLFVGAVDPDAPDTALLGKADQAIASADMLLKGLLDISRLDHATVQLKETGIALGALFADLVDEAAPMAAQAGLSLRHVPTRLAVRADADFLQSVLRNLLSNARRYTREGGVLIGARRDGPDHVRVEVWDTGPGIAPERREAVFEEFERDAALDNLGARGGGLGLPVARRMARLMGTDVVLRSVVGHGSVFSIRLPRIAGAPSMNSRDSVEATTAPAVLSGRTIWIVDDELPVREGMEALLARWSATVRSFAGPDDLPAELSDVPDTVLVDYDLGNNGDGLDVIADLRARLPASTRYALVSAVQDADVLARAARMDVPLLPKPVDPDRLARWLGETR
ncbi:PAS-domain containing protein [uncultured Algimonas sp.]|uniref:PAS-domain containing protein n=1 Tax=uncultured Algimonas sp. TaxID=1547920 RepID=UPI002607BD97|nr:PAS-domain containing protein [uncultured Algimonas sp.]